MCEYCKKQFLMENIPINTNNDMSCTFGILAPGTKQVEIVLHINYREPKFIGTYGIPINYCPFCGEDLKNGLK